MQLPIVLIGPMAAGKTTLSRALSAALGVPYAPLDWVGFNPMVLDGLDVRAYEAAGSWAERDAMRRPHHLAAVEAVLRDFSGFLLDFGAGHAHFEDGPEQDRLAALLAPLPNVFLLVPSIDPDEAEQICVRRDQQRWADSGQAWDPSRRGAHRDFARSASFRRVARHIILTEGRTVEDCVAEMISLIQ
ncbi:MAG: hypothetical protein AAFV53_01515 [Myxococcota bacterium]